LANVQGTKKIKCPFCCIHNYSFFFVSYKWA
jgi:hypothetical protein